MTRAKRNNRHDHTKTETSGDVTITAPAPTESNSAAPVSLRPDHATVGEVPSVSPERNVNQPSFENVTCDFDMAVRELAYFKWESAGFPEGDGFDFWIEAEREIRASQSPSNQTPE